jgi:UDP-glucose 4-epimerase
MATAYPDVELRGVDGNQTLLAIDKAGAMLGYEPAFSWRDHIG